MLWYQWGMFKFKVAFSLFPCINHSACRTFDWMLKSQSDVDWVLCKHQLEFPVKLYFQSVWPFASAFSVLGFGLKAYFWTKLVNKVLCWLPTPDVAPHKQRSLRCQSYTVGFPSKRSACLQNGNLPINHTPTNLTHWFDLFYAITISTVLENWN